MKVKNSNSILRIKNPNQEEFVELWKQYQPFLIEGVAEYWDACSKWSNDYLIKHCGNNLVEIQNFKKDFFDNYKIFSYVGAYVEDRKIIKYNEYLKEIQERVNENKNDSDLVGCYLPSAFFEDSFPEIIGDVIYPQYLNRKPLVNYWHGFSSKNFSSASALHFDGVHNIFVQIRGRKKILLYPPLDYLSFYPPLDDSRGLAAYSKVDPNLPNLELFPKFPWQEKIEIVIHPGEMLYIPPYWWHHVTAIDENISLSFFYDITIQDYFKQKNMSSVLFNIAPHYLFHAISSPDALQSSIAMIKSFILPGSFTESARDEKIK